MVFALPAIPAAVYWLLGALGVATVAATPAGQEAIRQTGRAIGRAGDQLRDSAAEDTCEECDRCGPFNARIAALVNELKKRYSDLLEDKMDMFNTRPTGRMSWAGHLQQFRAKQAALRNVLNEAAAAGCPAPAGAWDWASRPPPVRPAAR